MTQQEVSALASVTPLSSADAAGKSMTGVNLRAVFHSPYQSGDFQFDAIYMFDSSDRLAAVTLELLSGGRDALRGSLMAKYGYPLTNRGAVVSWDAGDDKVMFTSFAGLTNVIYEPRITKNNKGL
jgi:hypothetical protein